MQALTLIHSTSFPIGRYAEALTREAIERYLPLVPGWNVVDDGKTIRRTQRFEGGFLEAAHFLNRVADLAEEEDHHPDVRIYSYRMMDIDFATHSIGGLSDNDFIMAAKVNRLFEQPG